MSDDESEKSASAPLTNIPSTVENLKEMEPRVKSAVREAQEEDEGILETEEADDVLLFFTLASAELERLCEESVKWHLLEEGYSLADPVADFDALDRFIDAAGYHACVEFLSSAGWFPSEMESDLKAVRGTRNELVHDSSERHFPKEEFAERAELAVDAAEEILEVLSYRKDPDMVERDEG